MSQSPRITFLNAAENPGRSGVLYWMQASVRTRFNHALEYAVHLAAHRKQPLEVVFSLSPGYPSANLRHYTFLVEGLRDVAQQLKKRSIPFAVVIGPADEVAISLGRHVGTVVTDRGYTRVQRSWRRALAQSADCPIVQVESNVVVPLEVASDKDEWSAGTLRRKIHRHVEDYLGEVTPVAYPGEAWNTPPSARTGFPVVPAGDLDHPARVLERIDVDDSVGPVDEFHGGECEARSRLESFLDERLAGFDELRNVPDRDWTSSLSAYLHFGHISPVEAVLAARERVAAEDTDAVRAGYESFFEELVVRRELAANFTQFNDRYDHYEGLPDWARKTLEEHISDPRPATYSPDQLEAGETEDKYWNACQREMVVRGKMHGYMRMYWGKKILEWMNDPAEAMQLAISLNDKYELDGRDPNGYAGVAWCFGKHDRAWPERPVYGKVRYMNANGLKRKFKQIEQYVERWQATD